MAKTFTRWLNFLTFINDETRNAELLKNYFSDRCAESPEHFYRFLQHMKEKLAHGNAAKKKLLAERYLAILSPLCEHFGFFKEKHFLDDFCFSVCYPKAYANIGRLLTEYQKKSGKIVAEIIETLENLLHKANFKCEVKGRYKNIYSIHRKIQKKIRQAALDLKDIFAFRIITRSNNPSMCFDILNVLHDTFTPVAHFFKDYITIPKVNGYQSLHTGLANVVLSLSLPIEVQIRTRYMDQFAEEGIAAHWIYAQHKRARLVPDKELKLIRYLATSYQSSLEAPRVHFFSFNGDLFALEQKSTVLDFAYHIHSAFGARASRALVNEHAKPLSYTIHEGDRIKIFTAKSPRITSRHLTYVTTPHARKKIEAYLKRHKSYEKSATAS